MKKILIKIKNNTLVFKERIKLSTEYKNLLNTNVISSNELVFSDEYIENNETIVATFLQHLCEMENLNTLVIENSSLNILITKLFQNNSCITSLVLKDDTPLTYNLCEIVIKSYIKDINCYNLQPFMIELLDKHNIHVESRNEFLFLSSFMSQNNLDIFSSLFYKTSLNMDFPMNEQDEEDFLTFCKINKYLKVINVNKASLRELEFIIDTLKTNSKKNVTILIHDNVTDQNVIEYLKNFNKRKSKHYKLYFKLAYSDDYISNNIVKQTNSKILKMCGVIIIGIITLTFTYVFYDNYASMQNVNDIKETISHVIEITDTQKVIEDLHLNNEENNLKVINDDIASLLIVNPETVGWLHLNNTNIDYPVVQSVNNEYYLKHNFELKDDNNGWVFMDYRNNALEMDANTIIYAHNRYYSGVMFGTLQNTMRESWYTNEENLTISFRTLYKNYNFKIFSIYKIYKTTDYMSTEFTTPEVRANFFAKLKERSIYDFGITPDGDDKIITLSTCANNGTNRIVVHAVLVDDEVDNENLENENIKENEKNVD